MMSQSGTNPSTAGPHTIISLKVGGHELLQQLDVGFLCEKCGRETRHQVLYVGQRIAEVRCAECGQCMGMNRREVIRAFIGEVVMHTLRIPYQVIRELKGDIGTVVANLPGQAVQLPVSLARDATKLLRMARALEGNIEKLKAIISDVDTVLVCTECNQETPHRILYLGRRVAQAQCETCGRGIGMTRDEIFSDFVGEIILQLLMVPRQVRQELRTDFAHALWMLPREFAHVPFRFGRDLVRLVHFLRNPRQSEGRPKALTSYRG